MTISATIENLEATINGHAQARELIASNRDLTQEAKGRKLAEVRGQYSARALGHVASIWGSIPEKGADLKGGAAWADLERASAALQNARDRAGDQYDYTRLQVNAQRLPTVMMAHGTPAEFLTWYNSAPGDMRTAAQMFGAPVLRQRWGLGAGRAIAQLKADLAESENTPEVQSAQAKLDAVAGELHEAYRVTHAAMREFGTERGGMLFAGIGTGEGIEGTLSRISRPGPGDPYGWQRVNPYPKIEMHMPEPVTS